MRDLFDDDNSDKSSDDFAKLFEDSLGGVSKTLSVGDKIRSEVLTVGKEELFVSTGTMNDGLVMKNDVADKETGEVTVKVGDFLDLYVTAVKGSQIFLSSKPTSKNISDDLEDAFDMMMPVEGRVTESVNGGFRVNVLGKTAFCPLSQIDTRRVIDPTVYIGQKLEFMVTQFDRKGRNIVVSRRKLLDEQKEANLVAFTDDNKAGDMVKGTVTRMETFGAFVEIASGLDGLVHISQISWSRLGHPSEALKIGQEVSAKILKIEECLNGRMNISLSIKEAMPTPLENLPASIREGEVLEGRVTRLMKFGAFVEVAPGIEGLVPLGEMSLTKRVTRAEEVVNEGDRVKVRIKEVRADDQKLLLSIKDADEDADFLSSAVSAAPSGSRGASAASVAGTAAPKAMSTFGDQFKGLFDPSTAGTQKQTKKR
jgi:small subunit ribosomal protein S1